MSFRFHSAAGLAVVPSFAAPAADREEGEEHGPLAGAASVAALAAVVERFGEQPFDSGFHRGCFRTDGAPVASIRSGK